MPVRPSLLNVARICPSAPGATGYNVILDGSTVSTNQAGLTYNAGVLASGPHTWSITPQNVDSGQRGRIAQ